MPLPIPRSSETQREYVTRCYEVTKDEYPQNQAIAVCYSRWREKQMRVIRDLRRVKKWKKGIYVKENPPRTIAEFVMHFYQKVI